MRYLKSYTVFESGISEIKFQEVTNELKSIIDSYFTPHAESETGVRKFKIDVKSNSSNYGTIFEIYFLGDYPTKYIHLNEEFKQLNFIIQLSDIIKEKTEFDSVTLISFRYFGHNVKGQKDGHTKTIEGVSDKLDLAITDCLSNQEVRSDYPIIMGFNFLCK